MFDGGTESTRDPIMLRKIVEVKNADSKEASPDGNVTGCAFALM